jgi:hypothetical protein
MTVVPPLQVGGEGGGPGLQVCAGRQGRIARLAVHRAGGSATFQNSTHPKHLPSVVTLAVLSHSTL